MTKFKFIIPIALMSASLFITGCESSEDLSLSTAQSCLDSAKTEDQATMCINDLGDNKSPEAYLIRCSANLVAQGITGSRFSEALTKIDDKDSSKTDAEKTATVLSYFVAPSTNPIHSAETMYENCSLSGSESVKDISAIVKISTILARAVGGGVVSAKLDPNGGSFDSDSFIQSIKNLDPATLDTEALGEVVNVVGVSYCQDGSKHATDSFCISVTDAVTASSNLSDLGVQLINKLKDLK